MIAATARNWKPLHTERIVSNICPSAPKLAHVIVPDDDQQTAVQDDDLFAKCPPDNEQWFDQYDQIGEVLDQLLNARLELYGSHHAYLETEVAQGGAKIILYGDGLRVKQLAMSE
jgi:hypothetical protein